VAGKLSLVFESCLARFSQDELKEKCDDEGSAIWVVSENILDEWGKSGLIAEFNGVDGLGGLLGLAFADRR